MPAYSLSIRPQKTQSLSYIMYRNCTEFEFFLFILGLHITYNHFTTRVLLENL
jgi:hypothetical protein